MKKRPILSCIIAFAVEVYALSLITHMCNLSETVNEGVFSFLIMATAYLTIWLIIRKLSKNKSSIVRMSFIVLLILWVVNVAFYIEDYLL